MTTTTKTRPILFSGPMVRAILSGTNTQTRRVVKPQPPENWEPEWYGMLQPCVGGEPIEPGPRDRWGVCGFEGEWGTFCPYGKPGDRLWVREQLRGDGEPGGKRKGIVRYGADGEMVLTCTDCGNAICTCTDGPITKADNVWQWKNDVLPSIHMPRWASRITIEVKRVWVERVQEINGADSLAEGIVEDKRLGMYRGATHPVKGTPKVYASPILAFMSLWDSINGKTHPWESNPWVWCVEFGRVEAAQ